MTDDVTILQGDVIESLRELPDQSVHCVVTSPPYWGLRTYGGDVTWVGGDPDCDHAHKTRHQKQGSTSLRKGRANIEAQRVETFRGACSKCGARAAYNGLVGLEPSFEQHLDNLRAVFREVWRVLRDDGTCWLNYGDAYARGEGRGTSGGPGKQQINVGSLTRPEPRPLESGLKQKDLMMMPARVAMALQADGWYLRSEIIWHKCLSGGTWLYARTMKGVGPHMLRDLVRLDPRTVQLWNGKKWTQVTAWRETPRPSDPIELVLRSGERVGCTGDHRWPTAHGLVEASNLKVGDRISAATLPEGAGAPRWFTSDALWFAGLYLAEGSMSGETIQISGHVDETPRWDRIVRLCSHYAASPRRYVDGNTANIHIDKAAALTAILRTALSGRVARDKRIAPEVWNWSNQALCLIIEGYLEGDGSEDGNRIRLGFTRNYALERDLRCAAARLGATITLKPAVATIGDRRYPSFRGEWRWARSGHLREKDRGEVMEIRRSRARRFYDVSVADEPHLFALASGVLTHNSNPMPESVTDRPSTAHEKVFLLTKSGRAQFWTHEHGRGTRTRPEPDHYWRDRETQEESDEEPFAAWNLLGCWSRLNRWKGENYFYDYVGVRTPLVEKISPQHRLYQGQSTKDYASAGAQDASETKRRVMAGKMRQLSQSQTVGANMRNVLKVATKPFRGAHFATFPPELIRPFIKAGTSKRGACRSCGAPWARATFKSLVPTAKAAWTNVQDDRDAGADKNDAGANRQKDGHLPGHANSFQTLGFHPTCDCEDPSPVPCTVLDPFAGSGTTAVVALEEGCRAILCELKPEYVEIIKKRLRDNPPPAPWEGLL